MIKDPVGTVVYGTNSYYLGAEIFVERNQGYCIQFQFPADIGLGDYFISTALHTGNAHYERCFHWWEKAASFCVADCLEPMFVGQVRLRSSVKAGRVPLGDLFRAELSPVKDIRTLAVLEEIEMTVRVKNTSSAVWLPTALLHE